MSKFWEHFKKPTLEYEADFKPAVSGAVDDVRHKLIEEGWFGRKVTGDIGVNDEEEKKKAAEAGEKKEGPGQPAPGP